TVSSFFSFVSLYMSVMGKVLPSEPGKEMIVAIEALLNRGDRIAYLALSIAIVMDGLIVACAFLGSSLQIAKRREISKGRNADQFYQETPSDRPGAKALKAVARAHETVSVGSYLIRMSPVLLDNVDVRLAIEWLTSNHLIRSIGESGTYHMNEVGLMYLEAE